ncbi:hypothetical protein EUGRSUZ_D00844 [Eucalyptus grandis]|uniref:Uncharacterized protein n=2 Tax=Eucalyptus grandis TaxID=71139 RepID=A0ACC3L4H4_EUCGR|nr:hypothetical protein EUGRSUZ_D00844 [Eucalyptus grandis]
MIAPPRSAVLLLLLLLALAASAHGADPVKLFCGTTGNFTANGTYQANLNALLASVVATAAADGHGFYNLSAGGSTNAVNAIALCRGDVGATDCQSCLNDSAPQVARQCPVQKEAIIWYDNCMLRYSNQSIFRAMEDSPVFSWWNLNNVTNNVDQFNQVRNWKVQILHAHDRHLSFEQNICIAFPECMMLLNALTSLTSWKLSIVFDLANHENPHLRLTACLTVQIGFEESDGQFERASCKWQFDEEICRRERDGSELPDSVWTCAMHSRLVAATMRRLFGKDTNSGRMALIITIPAVGLSLLIAGMLCFHLRSRRFKKKFEDFLFATITQIGLAVNKSEVLLTVKPANRITDNVELDNKQLWIFQYVAVPVDEIRNAESMQYDLNTIRAATDDFSGANKLGQGGFGAVYKGTLANGQFIAVRRLSIDLGQGDQEFKNEVLLVARLQHRNLVRLLGFCLEGRERLLIYDFEPNSSLDHFIFASSDLGLIELHVANLHLESHLTLDPVRSRQLDWERRQKIIVGIARGLLYLHEDSQLRIIHRDLKASNILLDAEMTPKISDFGTARLFVVDQTRDATSRVVGTYGYMAPEYAMHGLFSVKTDVFSFGVLLLEIISGQKSCRFCNGDTTEDLLSYAWRNWREGTPSNLIDPNLADGSWTKMLRCIHIGLLCVQEVEANRPTVCSVISMLSRNSNTLPLPSRPAFVLRSIP